MRANFGSTGLVLCSSCPSFDFGLTLHSPAFLFALSDRSSGNSGMGQVFGSIQDMFHGRRWRERQIRKITDKVFEKIKEDSGRDSLTFEDVCIAVLYVYNDINKHLPGPHCDPPSKASLWVLMQEFDVNLDGLLDREEFADFIQKLTTDMLTVVSRNLIIALIVAPTVALLTKRATEGVPGVGKVVHKVPNSIYASIVTLGVVMVQNSGEGYE